jgi:hypothetical protein
MKKEYRIQLTKDIFIEVTYTDKERILSIKGCLRYEKIINAFIEMFFNSYLGSSETVLSTKRREEINSKDLRVLRVAFIYYYNCAKVRFHHFMQELKKHGFNFKEKI